MDELRPRPTTGPDAAWRSPGDYAFAAAACLWTLQWVAAVVVGLAQPHDAASGGGGPVVGFSLLMAGFGCWLSWRLIPNRQKAFIEADAKPERLAKRLYSYAVAAFLSLVAGLWNLATLSWVMDAVVQGRPWQIPLLLIFSLIGLVLLIILFTGIGVEIDDLLRSIRRKRSAAVNDDACASSSREETERT